MTLNVDSWLVNALAKEARISHFNCRIFGGKTTKLKQQYKSKILKKYGESFLNDADYIIIFTGDTLEQSGSKDKLFALTDRALGENANSLTHGDFKVIETTLEDDHVTDEDHENLDVNETPPTKQIDFMFVKITLN